VKGTFGVLLSWLAEHGKLRPRGVARVVAGRHYRGVSSYVVRARLVSERADTQRIPPVGADGRPVERAYSDASS
jgi:hypothetical protein